MSAIEWGQAATKAARSRDVRGIAEQIGLVHAIKNEKYNDSFAKMHKSFQSAFYNIQRKYARLELFGTRKRPLSLKQRRELFLELVDMAVYSVMCIERFTPYRDKKLRALLIK